jgi:hypothetical protein
MLGAGYNRSIAVDSKVKDIRIESSYVQMPRNAVGQLPFPAASVCSYTGNPGAVCLRPPLQYLVIEKVTTMKRILKKGCAVPWRSSILIASISLGFVSMQRPAQWPGLA